MPRRPKPLPVRPTPNDRARGYRDEPQPDGSTRRRAVTTLECPKHPKPYRYDCFEDSPACPFCETGRA